MYVCMYVCMHVYQHNLARSMTCDSSKGQALLRPKVLTPAGPEGGRLSRTRGARRGRRERKGELGQRERGRGRR